MPDKRYWCIVRLSESGYLIGFEYVYCSELHVQLELSLKDRYYPVCKETYNHYNKGAFIEI